MKGPKIALAGLLLLLVAVVCAQAAVIRVPGNYPTIQQGMDAASNGDIVLVADGIYTGVGNKDLDFRGNAITVKSENGPESTIIDCQGVGKGFYFHSGETPESVVSGFTIRNGSPGGDLIRIARDQADEKIVYIDVEKDTNRPGNDDDVAVEPNEIMKLDVVLENMSPNAILSVAATLRTDDTRVIGLKPVQNDWEVVDMSAVGLTVDYGTIYGNATKPSFFQFVKIAEDFAPLGDQIHFTLDITSGTNSIGSDEFDVKVGADIVLDSFDVDDDLRPGGPPADIRVWLRNITTSDIEDVRVTITPDSRDVDILSDDTVEIGRIRAYRTETASFEAEIDADFIGYAQFALNIEVGRELINIESFKDYFGMRTQHIAYWIMHDDNRNDVAEPGETIDFQIARFNPTDEEAEDVETMLGTFDAVITSIDDYEGDYNNIPAQEVEDARYEFAIADATAPAFVNDPLFRTQGHTVEFILSTQEGGEPVGVESFTMRIGGVIRYLPPWGYSEIMDTISDDESLGPNNNGNGVPEPGEVIEIEVTLINISDDDVEHVEAELNSDDDDVRIRVDEADYDEIERGEKEPGVFLVEIDDDFQGGKITFELEIQGEVDRRLEYLGKDMFAIPVWSPSEEGFQGLHRYSGETSEPVRNESTAGNGPTVDAYGGGICCVNSSSPTIESNIITGNSVSLSGGGVYCSDNSYPMMINNVIMGNSAGQDGGGIACDNNSFPTIINNTISGNSAGISGGGISCRSSSFPTVLNTILWGNSPSEIFADLGSRVNITYSDIQGGWSGTGNINDNPRFVNAANNDYHLRDDSPCIGTGTMAQGVPTTDIEQNPRPDPPGSDPDMGAYESPLPIMFPNVTGVTPSSLGQGAVGQRVTIIGTNFLDGATVSFSGTGITVNYTTFASSVKLIANISIASGAPVGPRDVTVTNPDGRKGTGENMFTVIAVDAVTVKVEVARTNVSKGESFSAAINIVNVIDLAGFQLDISFNPAVLEATQVDAGTFFSQGGETHCFEPSINNLTGMITGIACARVGAGGASGSGTLATITFKAMGVGEGHIRLSSIILSDPDGQLIPSAPLDGSVTVTEFPPWDVNKDGIVNIFDFVLVGQHFGEDITIPLDPNPDVNGDGTVNIFDFVLVGQHFGETYPPAAPSANIWAVDPQYLPMLTKIYNIMEDNPSLDPAFLTTKSLLHRLISNVRVNRTAAFQNYPNPFNPETWIPFQLSDASEVEVRIHDSTGQLIKILDLGFRRPGYYISREDSARWDGSNESGEKVASGLYFYTIRAGKYTATRKMILAK